MKIIKLSQAEKALIRTVLIFLIVQAVLIFFVIVTLDPVDPEELISTEITVEDVYYHSSKHYRKLIIHEGEERYEIRRSYNNSEPAPWKLEQMIRPGDTLTVKYREYKTIYFQTRKEIVDARTETEVYRTLDAFYQSQKNSVPIAIVFYSIIELLAVGYLWLDFSLHKNNIKDFKRKLKRRFQRPVNSRR